MWLLFRLKRYTKIVIDKPHNTKIDNISMVHIADIDGASIVKYIMYNAIMLVQFGRSPLHVMYEHHKLGRAMIGNWGNKWAEYSIKNPNNANIVMSINIGQAIVRTQNNIYSFYILNNIKYLCTYYGNHEEKCIFITNTNTPPQLMFNTMLLLDSDVKQINEKSYVTCQKIIHNGKVIMQ